ncbi:hypothetical protein BDV96DRAFT_640471 [Lophiotrema nucula]|uniref:Uncharacterized protein n=1 Tax=Lophiotrema nucula TaxID=690887 RepID=A0A6A5ZS08_9PLEO|nr:hypothetical protein BDV96DRAFT_640471 [Lophiotrema nucula]
MSDPSSSRERPARENDMDSPPIGDRTASIPNEVRFSSSSTFNYLPPHSFRMNPQQYRGDSGYNYDSMINRGPVFFVPTGMPQMFLGNDHQNDRVAAIVRSAPSFPGPQQVSTRSREKLYHEVEDISDAEPSLKFNKDTAATFRNQITMKPHGDLGTDATIAAVELNRSAWIVSMVKAVYNLVNINDRPKANQCNLFRRGTSSCIHVEVVESACHAVFDALLDRCKHGFRGPKSENHALNAGAGRILDKTANCTTRLQNVVDALKTHKTVCRDILYDQFKRQLLVNHPLKYSDKKKGHLGCNNQKAEAAKNLKDQVAELKKKKANPSLEMTSTALPLVVASGAPGQNDVNDSASDYQQVTEAQGHPRSARADGELISEVESSRPDGALRRVKEENEGERYQPTHVVRDGSPSYRGSFGRLGDYHEDRPMTSVNNPLQQHDRYRYQASPETGSYHARKLAVAHLQAQHTLHGMPTLVSRPSHLPHLGHEAVSDVNSPEIRPKRAFPNVAVMTGDSDTGTDPEENAEPISKRQKRSKEPYEAKVGEREAEDAAKM